jgi:hypothetical protein
MPLPVDDQVTGVCLSGGGVRAASVALGVLQAEPMRDQVLPNTQYLVSVSGGGYTAGAFVQALTGAGVPDPSQMPDPATAFAPGSPEQDHIRRHSSYLADTPAKLIAALGLVAGHLLLTLTLLYGTAIALGIAVGILFRRIPVTDLTSLASNLASGVPHPPSIRNGSLIALAAGAGLAVLFALAVHLDAAHSDRAGHHRGVISAIATFLRRLTILIAIVTIVLPELIWVSAWLLHHSASSVHVASPIAAVLLTYLAGLKSLFSGKKSLFNKKSSGTGGRWHGNRRFERPPEHQHESYRAGTADRAGFSRRVDRRDHAQSASVLPAQAGLDLRRPASASR